MSNHLLRELGVGLAGQGSVVKVSSAFPTAYRSRRAQWGVGGLTTVTVFFLFLFFLNHMFIVSTVQEMTCIFNDMAKTKPTIKITINKRNNRNQFPQRDQ